MQVSSQPGALCPLLQLQPLATVPKATRTVQAREYLSVTLHLTIRAHARWEQVWCSNIALMADSVYPDLSFESVLLHRQECLRGNVSESESLFQAPSCCSMEKSHAA